MGRQGMRGRRELHHVALPGRSSRVLSGHRVRLVQVSAVDGPRSGGLAERSSSRRGPRPTTGHALTRPAPSRPPLALPGARNRAVVLLARMGPVAVPPLVVALEGARTATARSGAADALGRIGDSRAVSRLIHALEDPVMTVRPASMVALQRPEAMHSVPRIARLLGA